MTGCSTNGAATSLTRDLQCAGWKKISVSRKDTRETQDQVLAHDEFGERIGCWKAPK